MKQEHKILFMSVAVATVLWVLDAAVDAHFFSHRSFLNELAEFNFREIYYRMFLAGGIIAVGFYAAAAHRKRRAIEERYRTIVELSRDFIYVADKDGNQVYWNDAAYQLMERTPEEIIGKPFFLAIHPDDRERSLGQRAKLLESKVDTIDFENRYVSKSGRVVNLLHNIRVIRNEKGVVIGTQGIARDITERKKDETALVLAMENAEHERAKSESILEAIGDGVSIMDADMRIVYQNRVIREMRGDHMGEFCYQAYAHGTAVCTGCPIAKTFQDGGMHTLEKTIPHEGDRPRTIEIRSSALKDASGNIIAGVEAVRDITIRKRATEQLLLFSRAMEEAMDGIQIVDSGGRIVYSNKAVEELFGFSPAELAGKPSLVLNADQELTKRSIMPQLSSQGQWSGEVTVMHRSGKTFPVWLSVSLVRDEQGSAAAMIEITRDITERKQAEAILKQHHAQLMSLVDARTRDLSTANEKLRQEIADRERMEQELLKAQKLESLGILAGGIAHDFNNLLASIMGNISLAMLDIDPKHAVFHQLESAERASLRAQDLTRQLLTFSKGGAPVKRLTALSDVVREAAGFALRGSRVRYDFFFSDDLWLVEVDDGQISQVIHNLVINADHAMPEGGSITIRCENAVVGTRNGIPIRPGDYVRMSVQDRGVGIAPDHLGKIFDPYFTTKQKGSGLGLATSYSIIQKHGGHILAESALGQGTTFTIFLPASRDAEKAKTKRAEAITRGSGRILLMDDEEDVRQTTGDVLKRLGYTVEFAEDGASAIAKYREAFESGAPFQAVIMDLTVPGGLGGKEALVQLLELDPGVKAIVSSGYSNDPIMADFRNHGFKGVVSKPYRISDLGETLRTVLNG